MPKNLECQERLKCIKNSQTVFQVREDGEERQNKTTRKLEIAIRRSIIKQGVDLEVQETQI